MCWKKSRKVSMAERYVCEETAGNPNPGWQVGTISPPLARKAKLIPWTRQKAAGGIHHSYPQLI